jgi:PAS domain S-box-containing protein
VEPDYSLILETLAEAIVAADRSGRILFANRAAEELLGWPLGGLKGLPLTAIIPPHLRTRHTAGFNRYRNSWVPRIIGKNIRVAARRKNGSELRVELTVSAFRGRGGEELYAASLRDLRGRMEAERGPEATWQRALDEALPLFSEAPPADERELAQRLAAALEHRFEAELAQLWALSDCGELLQLLAQNPAAARPVLRELELADELSPIAEAARSGVAAIHNPAAADATPGAAAYAHFPMVHAGLLLGVLVYRSATAFSETSLRMLRQFVLLAAGALHAARCRQAEEERDLLRRRLTAVAQVIEAGARGHSLDQVLERALELALELTGLDEGLVALRDEAADRLVVRASFGTRHSQNGNEILPGEDVPHQVISTGQPVCISDYQEFPTGSSALRQRGVRAVLGIPLRQGTQVLGVFQVASRKKARPLTEADRATLEALALAVVPFLKKLR